MIDQGIRPLYEGQKVGFSVAQGPKGLRANQVKVLSKAADGLEPSHAANLPYMPKPRPGIEFA